LGVRNLVPDTFQLSFGSHFGLVQPRVELSFPEVKTCVLVFNIFASGTNCGFQGFMVLRWSVGMNTRSTRVPNNFLTMSIAIERK